jgi:hypothetical protein
MPDAARALAIVSSAKKDGLPLTPKEREFCLLYFGDEQLAGNGVRSYMAIYPDSNYNSAAVKASELLKTPKVREFLAELQEGVIEEAASRLRPWTAVLGLAQSVIVATAQGRLRNRLAYDAAVYLTNRCLGTPVATSETHVINHDRVIRAVTAFGRRQADDQRKLLPDGAR